MTLQLGNANRHFGAFEFFGGSPSELVLTFLREEEFTPEQLEEIRRRIREVGEANYEV